MAIPYFIYQAPLGQKSRHLGRLLLKGTCGRDEVVERMLTMGSSLTKPDITAVLQLLTTAVGHLCEEGYRVDLEGLVKITPTLAGVFDDLGDSFETPRHRLHLTAQVSKPLNQQFSRAAKVEKAIPDVRRPALITVTDSEADSGATMLASGHIVSVKGLRLKFDPAQPGEGLKLVNAKDPRDFVAVPKFYKITQRELVFRLPEAPFTEAYFELASPLGSLTLRVGQSQPFFIEAYSGGIS